MRVSVDLQRSIAAGDVGTSGRVPEGSRHRRQQSGDTGEERLDRAGTREVEEDAILVLFDLGRHLEEGEDHRGGLGVGQRRV